MTATMALAVALGGAVGAVGRYLTGRWLPPRRQIPWGTLLVNVAGSFLLGLVLGAGLSPWWTALVGTGFCGALTTFSTFSSELVHQLERRAWLAFGAYAVGSILLGLAACWAGLALVAAGG
ncbi:fluoride efflux transporter FluC [Enemella evansiae]|nr:CrcB family protein [Enemella evansiae]